MRGVARQRHPAEAPGIDRILVDHRILEQHLGTANHLRNIEPIEAPFLEMIEKILDPSRLVPVVLLGLAGLDIDHPVDELPAVGRFGDGIEYHLAAVNRADTHVAVAGQDRFHAGDAAPGIDAAEGQVFPGIELAAHGGIDAVAADGDRASDRRAAAETKPDVPPLLLDPNALMTGDDAVPAQAADRRAVEDHVQLAARNAQLGIRIARFPPALFLVKQLTEAVEEAALAHLDRRRNHLAVQSQRRQLAHGMRQERDANAQLLQFGRGLVYPGGNPALVQIERQTQPGNAAADDRDLFGRNHSRLSRQKPSVSCPARSE